MVARIALSVALVTGLAGTAQVQTSRLQGQVSYPDRVQLGKTAVLEVTLEDVSDATGAAVVVGTVRMPKPGQTPVIFSIEYDTARVKPSGRYAVRARIVDAGATVLESATPVRVLTQGTGSIASVTLVQVEPKPNVPSAAEASAKAGAAKPSSAPKATPEPKAPPAAKPLPEPKSTPAPKPLPESKTATTPKPLPADLSAVAGAKAEATSKAGKPEPKATPAPKATPEPKSTSAPKPKPEPKSTPAPEAKATPAPKPPPAEASAKAGKPEPKSTPTPKATPEPKSTPAPKPLPEPKATPAPRPLPAEASAKAGASPPPTSKPSANVASGTAALWGTAWTVVEINGKPVGPADKDHRQIVLAFDDIRQTYSGTSGCTDLAGRFAKNGAPLTPSSDQASQICRVDEATQRAMRAVMQDTRGYRVSGTTLELLDAKGGSLARLER